MVGIVLVSHSRELSLAVKALADQQIQGRARIAAVGGSDNPHQPFGTDPVAIAEAIQAVYSPAGVLVLMDLGGAVISGKVALDLLSPAQAAHVQLCVGPFVEGAMAAAVQASIGMDLVAVAREAADAMKAKRAVLLHEAVERPAGRSEDETAAPGESATMAAGWMLPDEATTTLASAAAEVKVVNPAGLHFGPAARFVQTAARFNARIAVTNLSTQVGPVDGTRFNQLLALGAERHHRMHINAVGSDAEEAVRVLTELVAHDSGDLAATIPAAVPAPVIQGQGEAVLAGLPGSPGLAIGTAVVLRGHRDLLLAELPAHTANSRDEEWRRCRAAVQEAVLQLEELAEQVRSSLGEEQAVIFRAHSLLLRDPDLLAGLRLQIHGEGLSSERAVQETVHHAAQRLRAQRGELFQQRAVDVEDVGRRLLAILQGAAEPAAVLPPQAIVVAEDLWPSQTATLDRSRVAGFCTIHGGPASHTAILARSMGIPAVVGAGEILRPHLRDGLEIALDGTHGQIVISPDASTADAYRAAWSAAIALRQAAWIAAQALTRTEDGQRVDVLANLGAAADASVALEAGAEGVGLLRTEFLFQERTVPPTEDEQYLIYRQVAAQMGDRPVIIRTLDIGGDKPAPYLPLPREANPFLGWRAIRVLLTMPEFFKTQLRALLRAAAHGNVQVLLPMVSTVEEVLETQALLAVAAGELGTEGLEFRADVPHGIMIEVPAAVQIADRLAPLVDFFSIGTNDLTQYTFAADRTNGRVASLADPLHPAVLRQIDQVIRAAHLHGRRCGLCGELAGEADAIPILLGLGLDEFSMAPASIPAAKALLAQLSMPAARRLAQRVLDLPSGAAVRAAVRAALT